MYNLFVVLYCRLSSKPKIISFVKPHSISRDDTHTYNQSAGMTPTHTTYQLGQHPHIQPISRDDTHTYNQSEGTTPTHTTITHKRKHWTIQSNEHKRLWPQGQKQKHTWLKWSELSLRLTMVICFPLTKWYDRSARPASLSPYLLCNSQSTHLEFISHLLMILTNLSVCVLVPPLWGTVDFQLSGSWLSLSTLHTCLHH